MKISREVKRLSYEGCVSILEDLEHVSMGSFFDSGLEEEEVREFMQQVIQLNLDNGSLDEIEVLIVLSGE